MGLYSSTFLVAKLAILKVKLLRTVMEIALESIWLIELTLSD